MNEDDEMTARVRSELTVTVNLGNFNSLKFTHGVTRPCKNNAQDIARTERRIYQAISEVMETRLPELITEAQTSITKEEES